jgi:hypothetical protein
MMGIQIHDDILIVMAVCLFPPCCVSAYGQKTDTISEHRTVSQMEMDVAPSYVLQTKDFLKGNNRKGEKIDRTLSFHLKYAFRFSSDSYFGRLYPFAYQGVGISYNTFYNSSEVGNPIALYVFQGSRIAKLSSKLTLDYEWNFGASFGWKPYDEDTNPDNRVVGSSVNAYINIGVFAHWSIGSQWMLAAGLTATHYSNGNTYYPNSGVNTIGTRIGVIRIFDMHANERSARGASSYSENTVPHHVNYDLIVYGATRSKGIVEENYAVPGSFAVVGLNFNPLYNFSKYFKAGLSLDGQFDESANIENHLAGYDEKGVLRFYRPSFSERIGVGFSLRGEYVMPVFSINFGIGHHVFYKGDYGGFYQILALKTRITRNLFLHVGYQLNKFHDPKHLMLGFGYHFHNKRH